MSYALRVGNCLGHTAWLSLILMYIIVHSAPQVAGDTVPYPLLQNTQHSTKRTKQRRRHLPFPLR